MYEGDEAGDERSEEAQAMKRRIKVIRTKNKSKVQARTKAVQRMKKDKIKRQKEAERMSKEVRVRVRVRFQPLPSTVSRQKSSPGQKNAAAHI